MVNEMGALTRAEKSEKERQIEREKKRAVWQTVNASKHTKVISIN